MFVNKLSKMKSGLVLLCSMVLWKPDDLTIKTRKFRGLTQILIPTITDSNSNKETARSVAGYSALLR